MNDGSNLPVCLVVKAGVNDAATCTDSPKNALCGPNGYGSAFSFSYDTTATACSCRGSR
jgi:hypothetical protein